MEAHRSFILILLTCDLEANPRIVDTDEQRQCGTTELIGPILVREKSNNEEQYEVGVGSELVLELPVQSRQPQYEGLGSG